MVPAEKATSSKSTTEKLLLRITGPFRASGIIVTTAKMMELAVIAISVTKNQAR